MADFPGMMIPVGADDAAMRRVLAQAEQRVDQFAGRVDGSVRRAASSFDGLGAAAGRAGAVLAGLAGVQLLRGATDTLSDATKAAMAFQTAMAQVGTLLKGADTSRYTAQVKDLARSFGGLPTDQAKALYEIISAGAYSAAHAVEVLTEANKLAIGGVTQVQTAADGLTSVLNSYGAAAGSAANVADAFFASAAAGKTNIQELATYIGQVAPIAAQTGVSLDELMASAAALTANGIKTSTAMDGMRSVIAAVLKPSQEASAAARALGLEFNAGALKAKGFAGFLQDVADKTGGSSESLALLFGGVEALLPVMALASKESTAFAEAQDELRNKAGATEAAYGRIAETAEKTADRLQAAAAVYRIELGDRLLTAVQPAMAKLADNFDTLAGAAEKSALALGAVFAARGLTSGFGALTRAIEDQKAALYDKAVATAEAANAEKRAAAQDLIAAQQRRTLTAATVQATEAEFAAKAAVAGTAASNLAAAEASLLQAKAKTQLTTNVYVLNRALAAEREAETAVIMAREASVAADAEKVASLARLRAAQLAAAASGEAVAVANAHLTATSEGAQAASVALAQRASLLSAAWGGLKTAGAGVLAMAGGPWGAALLAGAGAVALIATRTTEAEAATEAFGVAQQAARDVVKDAATDVEALAKQYAGLSDSMKAVTRLKLEEALAKQAEAIAAQRRAAAQSVYSPDSSPFRYVEGNHGSDTLAEVQAYERMGLAAEQVTALRVAFEAFRDAAADNPAAISALVETLTGIGRAAGDAGKPLLDLARKLADPATKTEEAAKTARELAARLALLVNPSDEAARAVLGVGSNTTTAASGFQAMGGEVAGLTAKLADLAAKAKLLEVPAGYQRRLAELVGPEPANGDAKDLALWRKKRDSADATLRPIVGLETRDQTAELERQATGQRLLAGAVTDAAKAQAQNRIELAKAALEYPGLGAETAKTLLTTQDFGAALKALPTDLQARWAALQSGSQAQLAGAAAQGTMQLRLQTEAQARLAAAAGKGEAATRRAAIENEVAAAAVHGLTAATRANLEAQEKSTQQQLRGESSQPILARIESQKALVAAYAKGPAAVQAAEIAEKAHTLALKEGEEGTARYAEAKAHYIGLLEEQARGEAAVAAGPMLQQQRDQLELGQRQLALMGASAEQRAVELARTQALIELRDKNIDASSKEGQTYLANAEALAKQGLELERVNAAYDELAEFGDRSFDALLSKLVQAGKSSMSWADALNAVGVELQQLALKMALINPVKNWALGTNLPTLFDLGSVAGGGTAAGEQTASGGGLTGTLTNTVLSKGAGWAADKLGLTGGLDGLMSTPLWTGSSGIAPGFVDTIGATQITNTSAMTGGGATVGGVLGAAGAGALGGGLVGGWLGTAANSKVVGGLSGAAAGAGSAYLASVLGFGSLGGPAGIAIGAIVGAIMGMLGTTKASVGPNGAGNLVLASSGVKSGPADGDNGMDGSGMLQISDAASQSINTIVAGIGANFKKTTESAFAHFTYYQEGEKWTLSDAAGGNKQEFGSQEAFISGLIKTALQRLDQEGRVSGVSDDVRTALKNTKATKAEELANDLQFAAGFRGQFDAMRSSLDPTNNQLKAFTDNAKQLGEQISTNIIDWRDKAAELGLATEGELTDAARKGITAMLGLGTAVTPLRGLPAVTEQARINLETVKPALSALGYTAAEQADIAERYTAKAIQDYKDSVAFLQGQGRVAIDGLVDPSARLSVKDGLKAAGFDVADSGLSGVIAALQGLDGAAVGGTLSFASMGEALTTINTALSDGVISGDQYSTLLGSITAAWNQSQAVAGARRSGRIAFETALDPAWRADTDTLLTEAGLTAGAIDALRGSFTSVADGARTGTLSAGQLRTAYDGLEAQLAAGTITTGAFTAAVSILTGAWSESARTARALASYQTDVTARMLTAVGNARGAGLATLDAQQANELAEAQANGYDTSRLLLVQAAERARQAFDLAQQDVLAAYDQQIEAQQRVVDGLESGAVAMARIAQQFRDARAALRQSDDSPLAPGVKRREATEQFEAAYGVLKAADATDAEKEAARQTLLQLGPALVAMEKTASGGTASELFNRVDAVFAELGLTSAVQVDTAEQDLQVAQDQLKELQRARADAAALGQKQYGAITDLKGVMDQSYVLWQTALVPLQRIAGGGLATNSTLTPELFRSMTANATSKGSLDALIQYAQAAGDTGLVTTALRRAADLGLYYGNYNYADPIGTPLYERADQQYADDATAFLRTLGYGGAWDVNANIFLQANNKGDAFTAWLKQYAATRWGLEEGGIVGAYESGGIIGNGLWSKDSVLARFAGGGTVMLAGGEGVLTAGATAAIGADAVAYINRTHALPPLDVAPPSPTIAFRRPDLGGGGGADVAVLLAAVEGLRADVRAAGREALTQRARIGADAAELLARVEAATTDLPRKLANTRRAA